MKAPGRIARPLKERLESGSRAAPSGCIEWIGWTANGYGKLMVGSRANDTRRIVFAHRLAYEVLVGPIPAGLKVLHRCDNPPCVNPEHLFLGTQQENVADMMRKGRNKPFPGMPGEDNPRAKLNWNAVNAIRDAPSSVSDEELGERFNVHRRTVSDARRNKTWRTAAPHTTEATK